MLNEIEKWLLLHQWWLEATIEERHDLIKLIGGYQVSPETWYIHPTDKLKEET